MATNIAVSSPLPHDDETVPPAEIAKSLAHLSVFAQRYKPLLTRKEQEGHLQMYLEGLVSGLVTDRCATSGFTVGPCTWPALLARA
jgi:hypothetical protein